MEKSTQMKTPILKVSGVQMQYYDPVPLKILKDVDFEVFKGETVAIMGRSGEGKSTFLHILGTLENPTQGKLYIKGKLVNSLNKSQIRNRNIGFVFQSFHLLEDFTVLDNVLMPASIQRKSISAKSPAFIRAEKLLDAVGLSQRSHYLAKVLSGGEKQRVALARAMCNDPDILLADEPTGNLDSQTAAGIHQVLLDFAHRHEKTLIIVTHNQELANLCDKQYLIRSGSLVLAT